MQMTATRMNPYAAAPQAMKLWMDVSLAIQDSMGTLEHGLIELVKTRSSILNGCGNCINMHGADALAAGETPQRVLLLSAWQEAPCYTDRERAALAWTDALTTLSQGHTHDAAWDGLVAHFTEEERVKLTLAINIIGGWNRMAVGFGLWIETPATKKIAA